MLKVSSMPAASGDQQVPRPQEVFISYSRKDKEFTRQSRGAPQDGLLQARMLPDSSRSMDQQLRKFVR
jgi:hypothetical protein